MTQHGQETVAAPSSRAWAVWAAALLPLLLGALGLLLAAQLDAPQRSADERRFVIPPGTGERAAAGQSVDDILPQWITTEVGVALIVENRDEMRHIFGPFVLDPGQEWRREFAASGEYGFDCSLYPVAGFTIDVDEAPARDAAWRSRALASLFLASAVLLAAALAGCLGIATATGGVGGGVLSSLAAALPSATWAAIATGLMAMSRLADWRPVLGSRVALIGLISGLLALAAGGAALRLLPPGQRVSPQRSLPSMILAILAAGGLVLPTLSADYALRVGLLAMGGGLLAAALWAQFQGRDSSAQTRVAIVGFIAVVAALPLPLARLTPPWHVALSLPALVLGVGVLTWGSRSPAAVWPDAGWLARVVGGALTLFAASMIWWAGIRHLQAVSLPLWGNPTAMSAASVARGASLWQAECTTCHESPAEIETMEDREILEIITHGQEEMPGFAYRLDVRARGDLVNFLRRLRIEGDNAQGEGP